MKSCPVCNAPCFDEVSMCFECRYIFEEDEEIITHSSITPVMSLPEIDLPNKAPAHARVNDVNHLCNSSASFNLSTNKMEVQPGCSTNDQSQCLRIEIPWEIVRKQMSLQKC